MNKKFVLARSVLDRNVALRSFFASANGVAAGATTGAVTGAVVWCRGGRRSRR